MENKGHSELSFFGRLGKALSSFWRVLSNAEPAREAVEPVRPPPEKPKPVELPPERAHASGLAVLALLQREGRLVDFLQEDVASFSDAEVGAAARVVHAGCKKVFKDYFGVESILQDAEGASVVVPAGFDAQRIRITGNVSGLPPFRGTLKHHGWVVTEVRLPAVADTLDPRVLMAAEVEL